ncbi:Uncharacterized protein ALO36_05376 [Pseudomonas syringae pv. tomato]|nr:Uncharacterized protein ALO36_05376 [Pseudomonas syringae pv. tomato]RMO83530.1 hypothetical protein ALQ34_05341 [Pseudomonas syringae pv. maculicola]
MGTQIESLDNTQLILSLFADSNNVASTNLIRRNVNGFAVYANRLVRNQLTGFGTRRAEAHAVYNVVQTAFEQLQQVLACCTFLAGGFFVVAAELTLENAVDTTDFLLFTQLGTVIGLATAALAVDAWSCFDVALGFDSANAALQKEIGAFTTSKFAFWTNVTSHFLQSPGLHAALLRRTAPVVRDWRHVGDAGDLIATAVQCTDSGFTTWAWTLDIDVEVLQTVLQRSLASTFSSYLSSERGGFARTTETRTAGGSPRKSVTLTIGNGDDCVVKRRVDVGDAINHCLFNFFTRTSSRFCHD